MAKKTEGAEKAVNAILADSDAYSEYEDAKTRKTELQAEKDALESRVQELTDSDLDGIEVSRQSGMVMVRAGNGGFVDVQAWRRKRERERVGAAVWEGGETPEPSAREKALQEIEEATERIEAIDAALERADDIIEERRIAAQRDVRGALQESYNRIALRGQGPLQELASVAADLDTHHQAIIRSGLSPNSIQGLYHAGDNMPGFRKFDTRGDGRQSWAAVLLSKLEELKG